MIILTNEIKTLLRQNHLREEEIVYSMVCDRKAEGGFLDTHLILSKDRLFIITSQDAPTLEKYYKGYSITGKAEKRSKSIESSGQWSVEAIDIEKIKTVSIVNLVASGMVVIKEEEERVIAAFTNGEMGRASKFAAAFSKLKKQEAIDDYLLKEDHGHASCPKCGMIYPEEGRQICPKCIKKHAVFGRLLSFAGQYKKSMFLIILFMLLNSGTGLVIPYLQGSVLIDQGLGGKGAFAHKIGLIILLIIGFRTLSLLFGVLFGVINAKMSANIAFDLKSSVFSSMQRLSLSFFQRKQTGQLMTRVNNDAAELQYFFVDGLSYFIVNALNIIGITTILLVMDWKLTLLCFIPLPIVIILVL